MPTMIAVQGLPMADTSGRAARDGVGHHRHALSRSQSALVL